MINEQARCTSSQSGFSLSAPRTRDRCDPESVGTLGQRRRAMNGDHNLGRYDTISGEGVGTATYNCSFRQLAERAVVALEKIASAVQTMTAGQAVQVEPVQEFDRAYGTAEAAGLLRLNEQTVRKYCRERVFGAQTTGGRWVIRQSELDHFLKGQRRVHGKGRGVP